MPWHPPRGKAVSWNCMGNQRVPKTNQEEGKGGGVTTIQGMERMRHRGEVESLSQPPLHFLMLVNIFDDN